MPGFMTDPAAMNEKAGKLAAHADDYDAICTRMRQAATTMGSAYDSQDNRAFVSSIEACCVDLKAMADRLRSASQVLREQAALYTEREETNTDIASRLHN